MIYVFPAAVEGMEQGFRKEALRQGSSASIITVQANGARETAEPGDFTTHKKIITDTVAKIENTDVILLARFSMARASEAASALIDKPLLNSLETTIEKVKLLIPPHNETAHSCSLE